MTRTALTGRQLKAARALAGATQADIADAAGLHVNSVRYIERKEHFTNGGYSVSRVIAALEEYGIILGLDGSQRVSLEIANSGRI